VDRTILTTTFTQGVLMVYSGVLTIALCVWLLTASTPQRKASFDEIDVKGINLIEPDGRLRMVMSDKACFPGLIVKGKQYPHDRHTAGMLFFDDEGTENGGLIFGGMKNKNGRVQSWGHLSFDQYMGDQVAVLNAEEDEGQRRSGIQFVDQPDLPMSLVTDALQLPPDQRRAKLGELYAGKNQPQQRVYLGRRVDRSAALELKDTQGRDRIVMTVAADGTPSLRFLDESGKVVGQFPKEDR
jgi:hypothetical protein